MIAFRALQHAIISLILQLLFFPLWWYSFGAYTVLRFVAREVEGVVRALALPTLARFLLTPMFGFRDPASRVISFFVRVVHFFLLLCISLIVGLFWFIVLGLWIALPIVTLYQYWFHFFS